VGANHPAANSCFLNVPYDSEFESLFLAYIAGLALLGLTPRAAIEVPARVDYRLEKILKLMSSCKYSIHDLSRVELDKKTSLPRFNMAFETGLAVALNWKNKRAHRWVLFDGEAQRLDRSLSDLRGHDAYIHRGTTEGLFGALTSAFRRPAGPSLRIGHMRAVQGNITRKLSTILRETGTTSVFEASAFRETVVLAQQSAARQRSITPRKPALPSR
jgi:hypothetical protein